MLSSKVQETARMIGEFYLRKNSGDYASARKEILETQIIKLEVAEDKIYITTGRPGLLIGKRGTNVDALGKFLKADIHVIEDDDPLLAWLLPYACVEDF